MLPLFEEIARKLFSHSSETKTTSSRCSRPRTRKPFFEPLEERQMLAANVLYVDADVVVGGVGTSWNTACNSLQSALEIAASSSGTITEIWIADGTYTPTRRTTGSEARTESFSLVNGVSLYGGFAGSESDKASRAVRPDGSFVYQTVLSGDLVGNDHFNNSSTLSDNAYSVLVGSGLTGSITVNGLTITGGNSTGNPTTTDSETVHWTHGGGITLVNCPNITLEKIVLSGNRAVQDGAGLYVSASSVQVKNSQIGNNTTEQSGGGVCLVSGTLIISDSQIASNIASTGNGGGIFQSGGSLTLTRTTLVGNVAGFGGGLYQGDGTGSIVNSSFISNLAEDRFAIFGEGGGVYQCAVLNMQNTTFAQNVAGNGGAISIINPNAPTAIAASTYSHLTVSRNIATVSGGGILIDSGNVVLNDSLIAANSAPTTAAGNDVFGESKPTLVFSGANNLIGLGTGLPSGIQNGNQNNTVGTTSAIDPLLGSPTDLAGNGVLVLPMRTGSPAIAKGVGAVSGSATADRAAVVYTVTSLADEIKNDGILTFREAFEAATRNVQVGDAVPGSFTAKDSIQFQAGLTGTIQTNGKPLTILDSLSITGTVEYPESVSCFGPGALSIDAEYQSGAIQVIGGIDFVLTGFAIKQGRSDSGGGAILVNGGTVTLNSVALENNQAATNRYGGALLMQSGTLDCTDVIVCGNTATSGGGVYLKNSKASLVGASFYNNTATSDGGAFFQMDGQASVIANATFADNQAQRGGAIAFSQATSTLKNITVTANTGQYIGGISMGKKSTISIYNSIVAQNTSNIVSDINVYQAGSSDDNAKLSGNNNFIGDNTGLVGLISANGNKIGSASSPLDPKFAPSYVYCGQKIYPLSQQSTALIDAGKRLYATGKGSNVLMKDVRGLGYNREVGTDVDMGACEFQSTNVGKIDAASHSLREGASLALTGSIETGNPTDMSFLWDLNGNGVYGETGAAATQGSEVGSTTTFLSEGVLRTLGQPTTLRMILKDTNGNRSEPTDWNIGLLTDAPSIRIDGPTEFVQGQMQCWKLEASNTERDPIMNWSFEWNDGSEKTYFRGGPRNYLDIFHTYETSGIYNLHITTESFFGDIRTFDVAVFHVQTPLVAGFQATPFSANTTENESAIFSESQSESANPTAAFTTDRSLSAGIPTAGWSTEQSTEYSRGLVVERPDAFFEYYYQNNRMGDSDSLNASLQFDTTLSTSCLQPGSSRASEIAEQTFYERAADLAISNWSEWETEPLVQNTSQWYRIGE